MVNYLLIWVLRRSSGGWTVNQEDVAKYLNPDNFFLYEPLSNTSLANTRWMGRWDYCWLLIIAITCLAEAEKLKSLTHGAHDCRIFCAKWPFFFFIFFFIMLKRQLCWAMMLLAPLSGTAPQTPGSSGTSVRMVTIGSTTTQTIGWVLYASWRPTTRSVLLLSAGP